MIEELNRIVSRYRHTYSGTAFISAGRNTLLSFAGGYAHKGFGIPNTMRTRFDTASVTKVFTAAAILRLVEAGQLHLKDRITNIIDLTGTEISKEVTIQHLLTHTSGIADDADEEAGEDYAALFIYTPNYSIRDCKDFLPQFAYKPSNFLPGTDVRYNNCGFILLGLAIEAVTGMAYREYVTQNVFHACGMVHTCFHAMDEVGSDIAEGYRSVMDEKGQHSKLVKNIYSYPPIGTADAGAYTTVGDMNLFLRKIINDEFLSSYYSAILKAPHDTHSRPHRLGTWRPGYAFEFIEDKDKNIRCIYKEGVNEGAEAICSYYPRADICVNLLSNQNGSLFKLHREIQDFIIQC